MIQTVILKLQFDLRLRMNCRYFHLNYKLFSILFFTKKDYELILFFNFNFKILNLYLVTLEICIILKFSLISVIQFYFRKYRHNFNLDIIFQY
jgi:hypothetical protein